MSMLFHFAPPADAAEPSHPSLLFSQQEIPTLQARVQQGWIKGAYTTMKSRADGFMSLATNPYTNYKSAGGGRTTHFHAATLALTGLLSGEQKYLDKATSIVMSVVQEANAATFAALNDHLAVGDAAQTYSILYDWLYPYLTEEQRTILRAEIAEFGQWLYNYSMAGKGYGSFTENPLSCNHNSVLHGGLGLAGLVLGDHQAWVDRAKKFIEGYYKYSLDATGYSYEGLGYFGYGYWGGIPFSLALKRSGGADIVTAQPKNQLINNHILHQIAPWGREVVAMNDSSERLGNSSGMMYLINAYQDRVGLWAWLRMFGPEGDNTYGSEQMGADAGALSYIILFADPTLQPLSPAEAGVPTNLIYDSGRASYRTGWGDLDALVTFTSGKEPHRGHNHKDENSFTFYSRGEKFVIDPTYQPWETRSHNTVLVNGQGQWRDANEYDVYGKVIDKQDFGTAWAIKGEAAEAFPAAVGVAKAQRQLLFASGRTPYVVIADDYGTTSGAAANYTWLLHTDKKNTITIDPDGLAATIKGWKRGALCRIQMLHPLQGISLTETNLSTETFVAREVTQYYKNYFKEIQANVHSVNPRFVAVITAADTAAEFPEITAQGPPEAMSIEVKWSEKEKDHIAIAAGRFQYTRERGNSSAETWDY